MLTRILAACVGLPLLLAVVLFLPPVATAILFALACGVAAYEMLWRTGILKHRRILVYTIVAAMANVMWSWLRACSIVSEQTLWLCALLGLFVYFCALFCELLAAHTELRFTAVCVALFSGFVYPFLIGALSRNPVVDKYWAAASSIFWWPSCCPWSQTAALILSAAPAANISWHPSSARRRPWRAQSAASFATSCSCACIRCS